MTRLIDQHFRRDQLMTAEFLPAVGQGTSTKFDPEWALLGSVDGTKMAAIAVAHLPSLETPWERSNSQILMGLRDLIGSCTAITNNEERFVRCCFRLRLLGGVPERPVLSFYANPEVNSPGCESVWEIFPDAKEKILPKFTSSGSLTDAHSFGMVYDYSVEDDGLGQDQKDLFRAITSALCLKLSKFLMATLSHDELEQPKSNLLEMLSAIATSASGGTDSSATGQRSLKSICDLQYVI